MVRDCGIQRPGDRFKKARGLWLLLSVLCLSPLAQAQSDNWDVDGEHGELHVIGELTEAACRLDMNSEYQQVDLGNVIAGELARPGSQGAPVAFHIRLRDCLRVQSSRHDNRTGNQVWSANQPVVSVAFLGVADADSPDLVRLQGRDVSGVGLRLMNSDHQLIQLGSWGRPGFLDPGQDELTFYVAPERTAAPLMAGPFRATVDFHLNYE